ncbi:hypothetical protein FRB99_004588 [Tulasnella sp. 403]|nr:hypothetical protein FRB99_004588 [Tulasnella sp. 403]
MSSQISSNAPVLHEGTFGLSISHHRQGHPATYLLESLDKRTRRPKLKGIEWVQWVNEIEIRLPKVKKLPLYRKGSEADIALNNAVEIFFVKLKRISDDRGVPMQDYKGRILGRGAQLMSVASNFDATVHYNAKTPPQLMRRTRVEHDDVTRAVLQLFAGENAVYWNKEALAILVTGARASRKTSVDVQRRSHAALTLWLSRVQQAQRENPNEAELAEEFLSGYTAIVSQTSGRRRYLKNGTIIGRSQVHELSQNDGF